MHDFFRVRRSLVSGIVRFSGKNVIFVPMKTFLKLLAVLLLSVIVKESVAELALQDVSEVDIVTVAAPGQAELSQTDEDRNCYTDWNSMEICNPGCQFNEGRTQSTGSRVRVNTFRTNSSPDSRTAFCRSGKTVCFRYASCFSYFTGLLPSGFFSASQFLISLGKMRN